MRNLICMMLVVMLPLTLASQTQNRFKGAVVVFGGNAHINNILESHLKRELRLLGDVDIVAGDEFWHLALQVKYLENEYKDGTKTGWITLASVLNERIPDFYFKEHWLNGLKKHPVYPEAPIPAFYPKDGLDEYCVSVIGNIDKNFLTPARKLLR